MCWYSIDCSWFYFISPLVLHSDCTCLSNLPKTWSNFLPRSRFWPGQSETHSPATIVSSCRVSPVSPACACCWAALTSWAVFVVGCCWSNFSVEISCFNPRFRSALGSTEPIACWAGQPTSYCTPSRAGCSRTSVWVGQRWGRRPLRWSCRRIWRGPCPAGPRRGPRAWAGSWGACLPVPCSWKRSWGWGSWSRGVQECSSWDALRRPATRFQGATCRWRTWGWCTNPNSAGSWSRGGSGSWASSRPTRSPRRSARPRLR